MKNTKTKIQMEILKLAEAFEVEELEERVEFRKWNQHVALDEDNAARGTCGGGGCDGYVKYLGGTFTVYF